MGVSYREFLKKTAKTYPRTGASRGRRSSAEADKRSQAIKRQQGRAAFRNRTKESWGTQIRMFDANDLD